MLSSLIDTLEFIQTIEMVSSISSLSYDIDSPYMELLFRHSADVSKFYDHIIYDYPYYIEYEPSRNDCVIKLWLAWD